MSYSTLLSSSTATPVLGMETAEPLNFTKLGCDISLPPGFEPIHFVLFKGKVPRPLLSCSAESAIKFALPNQVVVVWTDGTTIDDWFPWLQPFAAEGKLFVCEINMGLIFQETPLQAWHEEGRHEEGKFAKVSQNDAHRLGILWHVGGIYYDADIVAIHSALFNANCNFYSSFGLDNWSWYPNGAIRLQKNDPLLWKIMEQFVYDYNTEKWGSNGVAVFNSVLLPCLTEKEELCREKVICPAITWMTVRYEWPKETLNSTDNVDAFDVWTRSGMWAVHWHDTKWYGEEREDVDESGTEWSDISERKCMVKNSLFHKVIKHSCPIFLEKNQDEVLC